MAHCALSDVNGNRYMHSPLFKLGVPRVESDQYSLALDFPPGHRADANGGGGHDRVTLTLPTWSLDLTMASDDATVPPALHYGGLCHDYACGGYTYYYSRPRMAATGTLTLDGTALEVSGTMWFDRQYGDLNAVVHRGWQWFAMGMNDGAQHHAVRHPRPAGRDVRRGDAGRTSYRALSGADFSVAVLAHWTSPATGIVYPSLWKVTVDGAVVCRHAAHRGPGVSGAAAVRDLLGGHVQRRQPGRPDRRSGLRGAERIQEARLPEVQVAL